MRVFWAVDPTDEPAARERCLQVLRGLCRRSPNMTVQLGFIIDRASYVNPHAGENNSKDLRDASKRALDQVAKSIDFTPVLPHRIAVQSSSSVRGSVRLVKKLATESGADLILASTHGRSGLERLVIGSFAETLILESTIPVLLTGPHHLAGEGFQHLVFPTDFSPKSKSAFKRALRFSKKLKLSCTLIHVLPSIKYIALGPTHFSEAQQAQTQSRLLADRKRVAGDWKKLAIAKNVVLEVALLPSDGGVARTVSNYSKKHSGSLIALASQSDGFSAMLLGSVGRVLAREAQNAVLFLR